MNAESSRSFECDGWWEQNGLGRQAMSDLELSFDGRSIRGRGYDIIGLFELDGLVDERSLVELNKHYLGKHSVLYQGVYDGEGTFSGIWQIGAYHGKWLIKISRQHGIDNQPIVEFAPT